MSWLAGPERAKKPVRLPFLLNGLWPGSPGDTLKKPVRLPFLLNGLWPGSPGDTLPEFRQAVKFSTLYQERVSNEDLTRTVCD
jgi:hypothetical protein